MQTTKRTVTELIQKWNRDLQSLAFFTRQFITFGNDPDPYKARISHQEFCDCVQFIDPILKAHETAGELIIRCWELVELLEREDEDLSHEIKMKTAEVAFLLAEFEKASEMNKPVAQ